MDLIAALGGAFVGGLLTLLASLVVARRQQKAQELAQEYELRRTLTVALVRSMLEFWECKQNPSANAPRYREVESRLAADIAMFNANLSGHRSCCVDWYVSTAVASIRTGRSEWSEADVVRTVICEPLLKWARLDGFHDNSWFEKRSNLGLENFTPERILDASG